MVVAGYFDRKHLMLGLTISGLHQRDENDLWNCRTLLVFLSACVKKGIKKTRKGIDDT